LSSTAQTLVQEERRRAHDIVSVHNAYRHPIRIITLRSLLWQWWHQPVLGQEPLELSALMHAQDDVATANELAVHVQLRNSRPFRVLLDPSPQILIFEHIEALDLVLRDTLHVEYLTDRAGETTLGCIGRALHEENERILVDSIIYCLSMFG